MSARKRIEDMASAAEQRLLTYLNWLTLLLGILVGLTIADFGLVWHDTAQHSFIHFVPQR